MKNVADVGFQLKIICNVVLHSQSFIEIYLLKTIYSEF